MDLTVCRTEYTVNMMGIPLYDIQQFCFSRGLIICNSCLDQMPGTIKFMHAVDIGPAFSGFNYRIIGIHISIGHLQPFKVINDFINDCFCLRISLIPEGIGCSLNPFCQIRIPVVMRPGDFFPICQILLQDTIYGKHALCRATVFHGIINTFY